MPISLRELDNSIDEQLNGSPKEWDAIYTDAAKEYGVNSQLLRALVKTESSGNSMAVSPKGAQGPAQLMPATAQALDVGNPFDPKEAIPAAARYLRDELGRNGGDIHEALMNYHAGPDKAGWGPLTQAYPSKVLANVEAPSTGPRSLADVDKAMETLLVTPKADADNTLPMESTAPGWNGYLNTGNAALLGGGIPLMAGAQAVKEAVRQGDTSGLGDWYSQAKDQYEGSRKRWENNNSLMGLTTDIVGSLPSTALALAAGQEYAVAPMANALAKVPGMAPIVEGAGNFLLGKSGNALARGAGAAVRGGLEGTAGATLASNLFDGSLKDQTAAGAIAGTVLGPVGGAVGNAVSKVTRAAVDPAVAGIVQKLGDLGIDLRGGQFAKDPKMQMIDRLFANDTNEEQLKQLTKAVGAQFGADKHMAALGSSGLTPDVMAATAKSIGGRLEDAALKSGVNLDEPFAQNFKALAAQAKSDPMPKESFSQIQKMQKLVLDGFKAGAGKLDGKDYQKFTQYDGPIGKLRRSSDPFIKDYATKLRSILDDALERTDPATAGEVASARSDWRKMLLAEGPAEKAGPNGVLDPLHVANALRGESGDLGTLGQGAKFLAKPTTQGGAEEKRNLFHMLREAVGNPLVVGGTGMVAGQQMLPGLIDNPLLALPMLGGTAAVYGGKKILGNALASPEYRDRLLQNALLSGGLPTNYVPNPMIPVATHMYSPNEKGQ